MKFRFPTLVTLSISVIFASALFTFKVFSYYKPVVEDDTQALMITLVFPDQKYNISTADLSTNDKELVIPTLDKTAPQITYNSQLGVLESVIVPQDYVLDFEKLRQEISSHTSTEPIIFAPSYTLRDRTTINLADYNSRLNKIYRSPLTISLKDGPTLTDLEIDSNILRSILVPSSVELSTPPFIKKAELLEYITARLTPKQAKYFNPTVAYENTRKAINLRFMGEATPVVLGVDDGPSSRGELAAKYLEVDLSQQKMYLFINHVLCPCRVAAEHHGFSPVGEWALEAILIN